MSSSPAEQTATEVHAQAAPESAPTPRTEYALWAVMRVPDDRPEQVSGRDVPKAVEQLEGALDVIADEQVTVRGIYDVSGFKADGDIMVWMHGESPENLQWALRELRRTVLLRHLHATWNAMGVHRDAAFAAAHKPSFMRGFEPKQWVTVYPFVRSYDWYLLPDADRRKMLADHGRKGAEYPQVLANTTASFGIGDYEWMLAFEADELIDIVDLMRHLRYTEARMHVREETPFYTGRILSPVEIVEVIQ